MPRNALTSRAASEFQRPIGSERLDALVVELNELQRTATLEFTLRMGRLIVAEIYGGDLSRWRLNRQHDLSFRQLASRTQIDLKVSATTLYRAVAVYDLCSRLPVDLWRDFGAAHLRAVLGLSEQQQVRLLSEAKVRNWTTRELYARAKQPDTRPHHHVPDGPMVRSFSRLLMKLRGFAEAVGNIDRTSLSAFVREARVALNRIERNIQEQAAGSAVLNGPPDWANREAAQEERPDDEEKGGADRVGVDAVGKIPGGEDDGAHGIPTGKRRWQALDETVQIRRAVGVVASQSQGDVQHVQQVQRVRKFANAGKS
jgi:hypothetical protein